MENLFVSLAYKYVALALMMAEANHAVRQLEVPSWKPIDPSQVMSYHVSPPRLLPGGSLDTQTHMFGFGKQGKLQFIHRREPDPNLSIEERHRRWATMKSLIDTNGAYALASNWLVRLEVDVPALEKAHPPSVTQEYYHPGGQLTKRVMLPRFEVRWDTNQSRPAVWVSIFGPTKEPIHIRQENISFSRRPPGLVRDVERLLAIPDAGFAQYSAAEKSNLVVQSALTHSNDFLLPTVVKTNVSTPQDGRSIKPLSPGSQKKLKSTAREIHKLPPASLGPEKSRPQP